MDYIFLNQPDKNDFIIHFINDLHSTSKQPTIPLLIQYMKEAQSKNISFTENEIELIVQKLSQNASAEETKRMVQLLKFL